MSLKKQLENWLNWQESVEPFLIPEDQVDFLDQLPDQDISLKEKSLKIKKTEEITDLETLHSSILNCQKCRLGVTRNKLVFGEGNSSADLMFIGEGPGQDEDVSGRPFVGKAGMLLTKIIENGMKIPRNSVYIANIVKCRPPGNRDPLPDEADCCIDYLKKQIDFVNPSVIVLLGKVAAKYLLNIDCSITKARENSYSYNGKTVFVTYHPSALLRNEKYKRPVWEDMKKVMKTLNIDS